MSVPKKSQRLSPIEYLETENDRPVRHEYIDGQIFAVAGVSDVIVSQDRAPIEITGEVEATVGPARR